MLFYSTYELQLLFLMFDIIEYFLTKMDFLLKNEILFCLTWKQVL